jgi:hypothetical protein
VIATVPFDLMFSVLVGLVFAGCARVQFGGGVAPWGRELAAVLLFEGIVIWPVALYFYFVFPDWSWMYLVDPRHLPWGTAALVLLAYAAALLGGYVGGWALLRAHRQKALAATVTGAAAALGVFSLVCRGRLLAAGSFEEYHAGRALFLTQGKLIWALVVTGVGVLASMVLVGLALWEQGRRYRSS